MTLLKLLLKNLNKIFYKIDQWWQNLGLLLLGYFFIHSFNIYSFVFYVFLGLFLLSLAHSIDDDKMIRTCAYLLVSEVLIMLTMNLFHLTIFYLMLVAMFVYEFAKSTPISAIYAGVAYPLGFWIPFSSFNVTALSLFFLICVLSIISELFHEAQHYDIDLKEHRKTTAIYLNFKTTKEVRNHVKLAIISIGVILLIYLMLT